MNVNKPCIQSLLDQASSLLIREAKVPWGQLSKPHVRSVLQLRLSTPSVQNKSELEVTAPMSPRPQVFHGYIHLELVFAANKPGQTFDMVHRSHCILFLLFMITKESYLFNFRDGGRN